MFNSHTVNDIELTIINDGDYLTEVARPYRECELYVGDDGKLYIIRR